MPAGYRIAATVVGLFAAGLLSSCRKTADHPAHLTKSPDDVVVLQLASIRRGDFEEALKIAAEPLRNRFSPETFGIMIRNGYASLAASTAEKVIGVDIQTSIASVLLKVSSATGPPAFYRYDLVREDGGWKISGVNKVDAPFV